MSRRDVQDEAGFDAFDLYSCFPWAVSMAKKMIDILDDDPRPPTLTRVLGIFGGLGNNHNLQALATLAEQTEAGRSTRGMVTALGWFMYKQAVGRRWGLVESAISKAVAISTTVGASHDFRCEGV